MAIHQPSIVQVQIIAHQELHYCLKRSQAKIRHLGMSSHRAPRYMESDTSLITEVHTKAGGQSSLLAEGQCEAIPRKLLRWTIF